MEDEKECDIVEEFFKIPTLIEDLGMMLTTETNKKKYRFGIYACPFCGTHFKTTTGDIKRGHTKSCGCYQKSQVSKCSTTHGDTGTRLYNIWESMKGRTLNIKNKQFEDYGGRGITICDEWKDDFTAFRDWALSNGYSDELSIDRIDNDKGYYSDNCRWATRTIQNRNQRIKSNNTSGFRGVCFNKNLGKFQARITIDKKKVHLGLYPTAVEGAIAYNNYITKNNLEGFILNIIPTKTSQP